MTEFEFLPYIFLLHTSYERIMKCSNVCYYSTQYSSDSNEYLIIQITFFAKLLRRTIQLGNYTVQLCSFAKWPVPIRQASISQ